MKSTEYNGCNNGSNIFLIFIFNCQPTFQHISKSEGNIALKQQQSTKLNTNKTKRFTYEHIEIAFLFIARLSSIVDRTLVWGGCCQFLQHKRRDQRP